MGLFVAWRWVFCVFGLGSELRKANCMLRALLEEAWIEFQNLAVNNLDQELKVQIGLIKPGVSARLIYALLCRTSPSLSLCFIGLFNLGS